MIEIRWNWEKWDSTKRNLTKQISSTLNSVHQSLVNLIDYNLIKCALDQHEYDEPIKNLTTHRLVRTCLYCGKRIESKFDYNFVKLEEKKFHIVNCITNNSFVEAKSMIDNLLREFE